MVGDTNAAWITLRSDALTLRLDPEHGAEIRSLVRRVDELELLVQTPWAHVEPPVPASEDEWTRRWPGGWQLVAPNAGSACLVDARRHGFHGEASLCAWRVLDHTDAAARLSWRDRSGLGFTRRVAVVDRSVTVSTDVVNEADGERPLLLVEHLVLGPPLAGPGVRIEAPAAPLIALDAAEGSATGAPEPWPRADGEDWSAAPDRPFTRFGALQAPQPRAVRIANEQAGVAVTVGWSGEALPHLWFWHEHGAARLIDDWPITCLGIEPSSSVRALGLADAIDAGAAIMLAAGTATSVEVVLTVA